MQLFEKLVEALAMCQYIQYVYVYVLDSCVCCIVLELSELIIRSRQVMMHGLTGTVPTGYKHLVIVCGAVVTCWTLLNDLFCLVRFDLDNDLDLVGVA